MSLGLPIQAGLKKKKKNRQEGWEKESPFGFHLSAFTATPLLVRASLSLFCSARYLSASLGRSFVDAPSLGHARSTKREGDPRAQAEPTPHVHSAPTTSAVAMETDASSPWLRASHRRRLFAYTPPTISVKHPALRHLASTPRQSVSASL